MSYSSASRSTFTGGGQKNGNDELDEYGGKKSGASRLKNSSGTKKDADADEEYPKYANVTKDDADRNRYSSNSGGIVVRGAGGGDGGYGNSSPNRGGGSGNGNSGGSSTAYSGGYGNSVLPYGNIVIHTNEVHLHHHRAPPGYEYDGNNRNDDQRRRGGGGGSGFVDRN